MGEDASLKRAIWDIQWKPSSKTRSHIIEEQKVGKVILSGKK